jgi:hypothetical protein
MGMGAYNGWSGLIRTERGNLQYNMIRSGKYPMTGKCELCGHDKGLTVHAEEYGSTWEAFVASSHELCPVCHGLIHMRWKLPNRWKRHKQRLLAGQYQEVIRLPSLGAFFGICRNIRDLPFIEDCKTGIEWVDGITMEGWKDKPPKVALIIDKEGVFRPDPKVYTNVSSLHGVRWDHETKQAYDFAYGEPPK